MFFYLLLGGLCHLAFTSKHGTHLDTELLGVHLDFDSRCGLQGGEFLTGEDALHHTGDIGLLTGDVTFNDARLANNNLAVRLQLTD